MTGPETTPAPTGPDAPDAPAATTVRAGTAVESGVAAAGGAALGYLVARPLGLGVAGAVVGGLNGAVSGRRGVYDWRRPAGWAGLLLDSTWGLVGTAGALLLHGANFVRRDSGYLDDLSRRRGYHVYARGWTMRRGFAFCVGNVITGAAGTAGDLDPQSERGRRRRRLVERHEGLHVWQQRVLGPVFPLAYGAWLAGGALAGTLVWLRHRDDPWFSLVETAAYYDNPFEYWAYRRDSNWPPAGAHHRLAWGPVRSDRSTGLP